MKQSKLWFKRRRYGYGWTPITWQGWTVVALFLGIVLTSAFRMPEGPSTKDMVSYFVFISTLTIILVTVTYKTGPKPKWRWGKKPTDNPDEDI